MQNHYRYSKGSDGCDETFDIYAIGSPAPSLVIPFWDDEAVAEATARLVVAALNAYRRDKKRRGCLRPEGGLS
ncbi:hypothetical protein [Singulisphaera sp. PoT]|uniref:hypothetical protein n=1 Tax=Singulisphaera sp. PoT TaxID=3411797 RepID=UPI003BF46A65